jgi:hypothetical protein
MDGQLVVDEDLVNLRFSRTVGVKNANQTAPKKA